MCVLDAHVRNRTSPGIGKGRKQPGKKGSKVCKAIRSSTQDDHGNLESWKIFLKGEIPVDGDKNVKILRGQGKQLAVLDG